MTPDIATALTAIDAVIGDHQCQHCGQPVSGSPSADFCSEDCQQTWHENHASTPPPVPATADKPIPETAPARLLGWLGQPPPEATVRPGHEVLDDVAAFVARFSVFPSEHCAPTLALWYAHTHAIEQFYSISPFPSKRGGWLAWCEGTAPTTPCLAIARRWRLGGPAFSGQLFSGLFHAASCRFRYSV